VVNITPLALGSSSLQKQQDDTDQVRRYYRADYDRYIREDLTARVFVDFEVFMKRVLHVPDDWDTKWKSAIDAVKADPAFEGSLEGYRKICNDPTSDEKHFYDPLTKTANAALDVLYGETFEGISSGVPQRYRVNDPRYLQGGVMSLSPDLAIVHEAMSSPSMGTHWANHLHVLEVKPYDTALCEGRKMPRLVVDGRSNDSLPFPAVADMGYRSGSDVEACPASREIAIQDACYACRIHDCFCVKSGARKRTCEWFRRAVGKES